MKKAAQTKQSEAAKRMIELRKGKQDLMDKQLVEQKKLIAKIETKKENGEEMKPEEKLIIMKLIKTLSESIFKTKDELKTMIHASTNKLSPSEVTFQRFKILYSKLPRAYTAIYLKTNAMKCMIICFSFKRHFWTRN